jgi:RNA polymerase sigma factor (sigma-70 family)
MNDLRLELRAKNARLWHVIFDSHESVAEFCRHYGSPNMNGPIGELLSLKTSPYHPSGAPTKTASTVARWVKQLPEDLFPPHLYSGRVPSLSVAEIPAERLLPLSKANRMISDHNPEHDAERTELKETVSALLYTLKPQEAEVLRLRFGLDGNGERSIDEIAVLRGVCYERVRQIESRAMRKLSHPTRARHVRSYYEAHCQ